VSIGDTPEQDPRDETDAAVDELLAPLHSFVLSAIAAQQAVGADVTSPDSDRALKRASGELRAALKRFADTLRT
jgi:hypothetical protein